MAKLLNFNEVIFNRLWAWDDPVCVQKSVIEPDLRPKSIVAKKRYFTILCVRKNDTKAWKITA